MPDVSYSNLKAAVLPINPTNGKFELDLQFNRHRHDVVAGLPVASRETMHIRDEFHYTPATEQFDSIALQWALNPEATPAKQVWSHQFVVADQAAARMSATERQATAEMYRSIAKDPSLTQQMQGFLEKFATAMVKALKL